ncbi:MAG: hypothetical protein LBI78_02870 [Campylobacteraceae bacterium]|jgi:hypothetical protein|nr:hypothetical protein [Campylobacteraceae bacterium]
MKKIKTIGNILFFAVATILASESLYGCIMFNMCGIRYRSYSTGFGYYIDIFLNSLTLTLIIFMLIWFIMDLIAIQKGNKKRSKK